MLEEIGRVALSAGHRQGLSLDLACVTQLLSVSLSNMHAKCHTCMQSAAHACKPSHMHASCHAHVQTPAHACKLPHAYKLAHMHANCHVCKLAHMHANCRTCKQTATHANGHTRMQTATHACKLLCRQQPFAFLPANSVKCYFLSHCTHGYRWNMQICCDAVQYKHECGRMSSLEGRLNTAVSMTAASSQGHNRYAGVSWTATAVQSAACKRYSLSQALCGPMNHIVQ